MFVLAHGGHWLASLIYLVPVALLAVSLLLASRRDRDAPEEGAPRDEPTYDDDLEEYR